LYDFGFRGYVAQKLCDLTTFRKILQLPSSGLMALVLAALVSNSPWAESEVKTRLDETEETGRGYYRIGSDHVVIEKR
jgi:hypothetical protein